MTRKDLIKKVAERTGKTQKVIEEILVAYENCVYDGLQEDGVVKVMDGVTFSIKPTKARQGRNPHTGDTIAIPAGKKISAKFGKTAKDFLKEF